MMIFKRAMMWIGRGLLCLLPVICTLLLLINVLLPVVTAQKQDAYTAGSRATSIEPIVLPCGDGRININTATVTELDALPGVGPAIAQAIIDEREANGPYYYPEDLMDAKGIGASRYEAVEDMIMTGE